MLKISFVILTWNSGQTIDDCLTGIGRACGKESIDYEVFVVDNGSHDRSVELVTERKMNMPITLIRLPKNMGTTKPRNDALKLCSGNIICIVDSDAVFLEGSLKNLTALLLNDETIGILAPKLIFSDGTVQDSVRQFPSVLGKFSRIPAIIFKLPVKDFDRYNNSPFSEVTEVDYAISACWFFRRELLNQVGYLDERIFYAPEDVDYGLRVWKKGEKTMYYPHFTVLHHVQRLTHKNIFSRIALSHLCGVIYYFLKHRYFMRPNKKGLSFF
jgi:GT2 family glycosyltransferase